MPCGNGLTLSKRKHGVCVPGLGLFSSVLVALCCLEVWGSEPRECTPCPLNCSCAMAGPLRPCVVNCSNTGLEKAPSATDLPLATNVLDLSKNHISSLDTSLLDRLTDLRELYLQGNRINVLPRGIFCCGPLSVLDLSNNLIITVKERICDNLCNLTQIDLSNNPFECDCKLFRLVSWLQKKGVRVRRPESMLCKHRSELHPHPLLNISQLTCGMNYVACLEDSSSVAGGRNELVIFSSSTLGNFSREQCTGVCLLSSHRYGGLGARRECLCSTNSEPNFISESDCSAACTKKHVMEDCGWTRADDVFAVDFTVSVKPLRPQSVHDQIGFSAASSVSPVTLSWNFGDQSPRVNSSETEATKAVHKYGLPGQYKVGVTAWIGHKEQVSAQGEVTVMLPAKLQLLCPDLVVANKSLEISLLSWGALGLNIDWKITKESIEVAKASPHCPGGVVHNETSHCFQILPEEMNWTDARQQCLDRGGDLAIVRTDTLRGLLALNVTQERGVWLGLSDVQSPGKLLWVNGSEAQEGEEGPPPRSVITSGNMCISLDQRGQTSSHRCNIRRAYVCELKPQVRVPDAGVYMVGLAVFPAHNPLLHIQADQLLTPKQLSGGIEVLLFPALNFVHAGRLSSLEVVTQELHTQVQVRFQTYRPHCHHPGLHLLLPGCGGVTCAPVAVCVPIDSGARDPPSCPPLQQWCPFQQQCLALSVPCPPSSCPNCSQAHRLTHGLLRPRYLLQNEVVFTLQAGPSAHIQIQDQLEDLLVSPGDVFALQHDAGPGSLLCCQHTSNSPWHQSVLTINQSEWFWLNHTGTHEEHEAGRIPDPELDVEALVVDGEGRWMTEVVCPVRVLYTGHSETQLQGKHLMTGLKEPGLYSLTVYSDEPSYPASDTCLLRVVPPLGLTIIHPTLQNGSVYLQPNDTRILLRVQSRYSTSATWSWTNHTVTFLPTCPSEFVSSPGLCQPSPNTGSQAEPTGLSQYAVIDLGPGLEVQEPPMQLKLEAHNNVTEASLSVAVHLEAALQGLMVQPHPAHRVLMESVVSYTASVQQGSNPTFKWTVDDKPYFTYYNTVLNVIYQHAAVYKLTVTAMNHVSTITHHFNVTVDRLVPMANLSVRGVPDVVPQGSTQSFTTSVLLDMSVTATFRWCFGDGGYKEFEYKPPYSLSLPSLDSPNQILLINNVTYVYSQPGIYTALVSVSNRFENLSQTINMSVYSILNHVDIQTEPQLLLAGQPAEFEAHPLPSPYGIQYDWHLGDGSAPLQSRRVNHTYTQSGIFNICVIVNNTISSLTTCADMFVFEKIEHLIANTSSPSELHCPTIVWAHISSGNNVTWTFSMGDGSIHTVSEPYISHHYNSDGNYTVNVTASNAVSAAWIILPVHVFVFQINHIEPAACIHENTSINFLAFVTGNSSAHLYEWKFGDDNTPSVRLGNPQISHTYMTSGNYNLTLSVSSGISNATKDVLVCVEPALQNISFTPEKSHYGVEDEIWFQVRAEPNFNYSYQWDFGQGDNPVLVVGSGNVPTKYTNPGHYIVTVNVFNNISFLNTSIEIEVQMPIGPIVILHNGTKHNNLTLREPYDFHTTSLATNVSYTWHFGDGFVQSGPSIVHAYNVSGNYNITVTAVNTVSSNQTVLPVVVLALIRNLTLNSSLINVPLNASVNFETHMDEGDGVRYSWILCDHCSSIAGINTMFYTFRSVGTFTIIVIAENDINTTQASILLFVQRELEGLYISPEDEIGGIGPMEGCCYATNRTLHLQAGLKEGTNMTFTWNLIRVLEPLLSVYNVSGKTVELNVSSPGPCNIVLRADNLLGHLVVNRTINFLERAGMVSVKISQNPVAVNTPINMSVLTNKGSDLQYRWSINKEVLQWNMPSKQLSFDTPGLKSVEIEVLNNVSSEIVSETILVQENITGLKFTINSTELIYASTGYIVWLQGEVTTGTNVTWTWTVDGQTKTGNKTSHIFLEPKQTVISLKASNDINEQVVAKNIVVQKMITGLLLKGKRLVALGEKVEFTVTLAAGTDPQIDLSINGEHILFMRPNQTFVHIFTKVGVYKVTATIHNQVTLKKKHSLHVTVMDPVRGLSIKDCCPTAIAVGVKKTFTANIWTGSNVSFLWTLDLHHLHKFTHMSKEVSYVPEEPGILTIYLKGFNSLGEDIITKDIKVQNLLRSMVVYAAPRHTFINKTVTLMASVMPRHTPVDCLWELGDGSAAVQADTTISYIYKQSGHYLVQVNCSNQVSSVLGQVEVNITVLECEEPEVQVVQAPRLSIWRAQPTLVEAFVDLKGCLRYGEQYLWQILAAPSCGNSNVEQVISEPSLPVPVIDLPDVDTRRLQLSLPKMSLPAGSYSLVFSLSYEGVPLRKAACLQLSVMAARLMPIIEGGTYRVWSRSQDLQLSAVQSYDPNMDPDSQSLLEYTWKCIGTSEGPEYCSTLNFGLGSNDPVLGISGVELEAGVEYTFKLTISKTGMAPESTTQTVLVQSGHIPMVYLECVSCKAQSFYEVSQNSYVYLKGTCTNCKGFHRGRWTAMTSQNETLVLDSSSTTTGSDGMHLVLRQGVLREGDSYNFTLHVTDSGLDGEGAASITLQRNQPPAGGECHLKAGGEAGVDHSIEDGEIWRIHTLVDRVHFNCSGFSDVGVSETPLLYSLLVTRCKEDYCEDFCVYRGSSPEHAAFLPPGFSLSRHRVAVSITVEDHQGATNIALNKSLEVGLPVQPLQYKSLPHWLSDVTDTKLKKLLEQGDSQRVRELSLALITILNEYEHTRQRGSQVERLYRIRVRSNITRALTSLDLTTVNDIQQTSAALAQCTAVNRDFICEECQNSTLNKLESMLKILQTDTKQGTVTPTEIADNILNIMGDLIHQVSQSTPQLYASPAYVDAPSHPSHPITSHIEDQGNSIFDPQPPSLEPHPLRVAAKAYSLSSVLMLILMHARVLNEEPLRLRGAEIAATGKLADPQSLLCYQGNNSPECQRFSIPRGFNKSLGKAAAGKSIMQLLFQVESNPFPFNYVPNYTVSTEVASMEFRTENGTQIPISGLDDSLAITVAVNNGSSVSEGGSFGSSASGLPSAGSVNRVINHCDSVIVKVNARNTNRKAGLFVQLNFTSLEDAGHKDSDIDEDGPYITAYLHFHDRPNEFNSTDKKHIYLNMTRGQDFDHKKFTFFLSPEYYDTTLEYFINVSAPCSSSLPPVGVRLEVGVFASLCQYFSESAEEWRTDGMVPLAETNATRAVCRTRHLTAFAAGLFVPPNAVSFKDPERHGARSLVVLLVCVLGLLSYIVAAAILHKLDQIDLRRAGVVPLCGQEGLFKYEVQVKTGWSQGAGTTAHVGISLYGRECRSGHRHLDSRGAFTRNALDIFHIATDTSLGNVWKIRIWHDNKGLSPAWLLQYILVKDLQTGSSYYFLVDDWLSVDNEKTGRKVEIEVEASEDAGLRQMPRLLRSELERAVCESHLWLSLWERPPRSPFTRLQRATCCALLLQLILMANTLWYSVVIDRRISPRAVSTFSSLNGETVAAGVVVCLLVYPLYLLVFTLFRMSRSKCVTVEQVPPQGDQESVEIDDFLDNSMAGSSFLFFSGETNSEETNVDLPTPSTKSDESWDLGEDDMEDRDWPELTSEASVVGGAGHGAGLPRLKRGQGSRHLGVDLALNPDNEDGQHNKYFTSDEDLIKHILSDGQNFFPEADESEMADLSSIFGDKTEVILLQKLNEPLPLETVRRDPPKTAFESNTVVTDVCRPRRFPPWCGQVALWGSWAGIALASFVSIWAGYGFGQKVAMMWLISCFSSVLCSCLLLEPMKVICEAVYYAVCVRRLRPEDQDMLVEFPRVERVVQRVHRVQPPQGFSLSQARQQARKVHMLHTMLKNFLVYMFLLLVVILLNYSDSAKDTHSLRLHTQLQRALHTPEYHNITSRGDVVTWLNGSLLPRLLDDARLLQDTGSVLLGTIRLRQIRDVQEMNVLDDPSVTSPTMAKRLRRFGKRTALESGDVIHQLNRSLGEAISSLELLQRQQWLNYRTRAVVVEFPLYNINTNLLAVFSFVFNFPVSERAQGNLDLLVTSLWPITALDLPLLLTIVLFALVVYFLVRGVLGYLNQGYTYLLSSWRVMGVCKLALALSVCGLHLSRCVMAKQQWTFYLRHPRDAFTDFCPVARQSQLFTVTAALLLFVLVLKASHQLRFLREWAVFGRTLRRSGWELLSLALALLFLLLAYAHTGHLLFHSVFDGYSSVSSASLSLLGTGGRGLLFWRPVSAMSVPSSSVSTLMFHTSFAVLRLLVVWFVIAVLLRNYRRARAELYRPAVDLQDYEMVELFLRRLKMWMGLSRAKEFRHKVRFEGMELPPSRSSSTSDCRSLCLPPLDRPDSPSTPDSVDGGSEASWRPASSSPCSLTEAPGATLGLGLGLGLSPGVLVGGATWKEKAETEAALGRVLPTLDALLQQLDRVTMATEDLYYVECKLEKAQKKRTLRGETCPGTIRLLRGAGEDSGRGREKKSKDKQKKKEKKGDKSETKDTKKTPLATPVPFFKSKAPSSHLTPNSLSKSTLSAQDHVPLLSSGPKPGPVHTLSNKSTPAAQSTPNTPGPSTCASTPTQSGLSSLFNHPAHTTTIPTSKRKHKPPPLKNKVHPNLDKS
ncbi:polycystin-1 [Eucyclogobius newberryi]|uniref:polycystin-1 n=1 Tax=Eucyclogobius newberryi TaxID=166745 RepID=UPI003B5BF292